MSSRQATAVLALALCLVTVLLAVVLAIVHFPRGLIVFGCVALAVVTGGDVLQPPLGRWEGGALPSRRRGAQAGHRGDRADAGDDPRVARPGRAGEWR